MKISNNSFISSALLLKAERRTSFSNKAHLTSSTIDFKTNSFNHLCFFNDVFLSPNQSIQHPNTKGLQQIILPIAGSLFYEDIFQNQKSIASDEIAFINPHQETLCLHNPYETKTVNYLHFGIETKNNNHSETEIYPLLLNQYNQLVTANLMDEHKNIKISLGIYEGRAKTNYQLKASDPAFIFIINGAFEIENRLLEHRDGLCLWDTCSIEFESLSNNAIILILELPSTL